MDKNIREYKSNVQSNIANHFKGNDISKKDIPTITKGEFDQKFDVGYETFTQQGLHNFVTQSLEKGVSNQEINNQLSTLDEMIIKGEDDTQWKVFVREIERGQEAETE